MGKTRRASRGLGWAEARSALAHGRKARRAERERRRRDREATAAAGWQGHGSCGRKSRFETRQQAESWAAGVAARFGDGCAPQVAYRCQACGGWHLTSHPWGRG